MILPLSAVAFGVDAHAQGFDAQRYVPPVGAAGGLLVERPVIPEGTTGSLAVFVNYARNPLVLRDRASGEIVGRPLHQLSTVDLLGSFSVLGQLELGVHLPVTVFAEGDPFGTLDATPGLGDLRLVPKFTLFGSPNEDGFRLGMAIPIRLPTGDPRGLRGTDTVTVEPDVLFGVKQDGVRLHANVGYRARPGLDALAPVGDEFTYGLGAAVALVEGRTGLDLLVEGQGAVDVSREGPEQTDEPLELLAGLGWRPTRDVALSLAGGPGLTNGLGTPDYRVLLGLRYSPQADTASRTSGTDADGDRVPADRDYCPKEKEDYDGFEDRDGCPDDDNDGDRIPDDDDECPQAAEQRGGDGDGCPDPGGVRVTDQRIEVDGKVLFAFDSDEIDRRSYRLIDEIARVLKANPEIGRVYIQGHTDNVGESAYNDDLSLRRANSVRRALIARGIDPERLITRGYGERRSIAPNDTPAGRAQNRRVEFLLKE